MTEPRGRQHDYRRDILFAFALVLACYMAWLLRNVLVLLYVAALFAVVLAPVVSFASGLHIGRWHIHKGLAVFVLLLVVAGALAAFPLVDRMDPTDLADRLQSAASKTAEYILASAGGWAGEFLSIFTGIVLTLYFILEGDRAYQWFLSFAPPLRRKRLDGALQRAGVRMGRWLLGQASLMLILGVTSTVLYASLHIRYAYALGVLTGLLNFIPVLGAAITIGLVLVVAAVDSWGRVLGVAIFYLIYLNVENSYLVPRIMKSRVDLPGLAILVSLLMGFSLAGIVGALVAVPTAVLVAVLLDEYLVWKEPEIRNMQ